jgi:hypothetical protein
VTYQRVFSDVETWWRYLLLNTGRKKIAAQWSMCVRTRSWFY